MNIKTTLALAAGAFALWSTGAAGATASYTDPSGDNGAAADVGAVAVDLTGDGYLSVKMAISNVPLGQSGIVLVAFDTDRSGSTGNLAGGEYLLFFDFEEMRPGFAHWNGTEYVDTPADVIMVLGAGSLELKVKPASLGGVTSFNFIVSAATGAEDALQVDRAPDGGTWFFEPAKPNPVTVETIRAKFVPAVPRAGGAFQAPLVRIKLSDGKTIVASSFRCVAQLGGKLLRGTGRGGCTFRIPKQAKGMRLRVTVFVTYKGVTDEFDPYVFRVR